MQPHRFQLIRSTVLEFKLSLHFSQLLQSFWTISIYPSTVPADNNSHKDLLLSVWFVRSPQSAGGAAAPDTVIETRSNHLVP